MFLPVRRAPLCRYSDKMRIQAQRKVFIFSDHIDVVEPMFKVLLLACFMAVLTYWLFVQINYPPAFRVVRL